MQAYLINNYDGLESPLLLAAEDLVGAAPAPKIGSSSQLQRASRSPFFTNRFPMPEQNNRELATTET